ncbi:hypothetical protein LMG22931_05167 [Paraburkholderia nemoris]|nr:hypothetical protein LMG22931_05167 [Paraburkholderia nemoris]
MKRTAFSTISLAALASAGAAHAQSSVTLYGAIDTSLTYVHNAQGNKNLWLSVTVVQAICRVHVGASREQKILAPA